ncbi:hypothetical protein V6N13_048202 [Hibiscus sabdariffa]
MDLRVGASTVAAKSVENQGIRKNVAYMALNPDKKTMASKKGNKLVYVVPTVDDQAPRVFEHSTDVKNDIHTTIHIVEQGELRNEQPGSKGIQGRFTIGKELKDCVKKSMKIRKPVESKTSHTRLDDWVLRTQSRLDEIGSQGVAQMGGTYMNDHGPPLQQNSSNDECLWDEALIYNTDDGEGSMEGLGEANNKDMGR